MPPVIRQAAAIRAQLEARADPETARHLRRFYRTGPGQYAEGDHFLGIRVPQLRALAREHAGLPLAETQSLLRTRYHEARQLALLLLIDRYRKGSAAEQQRIYDLYLGHTDRINNWDLVDVSAAPIVGAYLLDRDRTPLHRLAGSNHLWDRRIAIVATHHFIRRDDCGSTLELAELLLRDPHDLIHKATGWMLREAGKRNRPLLERFLDRHLPNMPRTMLRYAIERFPEPVRLAYLHGR